MTAFFNVIGNFFSTVGTFCYNVLEWMNMGLLGKHYINIETCIKEARFDSISGYDIAYSVIAIILIIIAAYLLGSINFAILISGISYKQDIREFGSKNAGMTNMMRIYGKKAAAFTLIGDAFKAFLSCIIGYVIFGTPGAYFAGLFCILGHVFPIYYNFKGGKGVVTAGVTIFMCNPPVFLIIIVLFFLIVLFSRYISLGSVMCMLLYPIILERFVKLASGGTTTLPFPYLLCAMLMTFIIVAKHWTNIKRLLNGTENKFSFKKSVKTAKQQAAEGEQENSSEK